MMQIQNSQGNYNKTRGLFSVFLLNQSVLTQRLSELITFLLMKLPLQYCMPILLLSISAIQTWPTSKPKEDIIVWSATANFFPVNVKHRCLRVINVLEICRFHNSTVINNHRSEHTLALGAGCNLHNTHTHTQLRNFLLAAQPNSYLTLDSTNLLLIDYCF